MEKDKIVVGLDIGTTKICAIVGRKNEYGKLEVLGMGKAVSDGVIRGIVSNIDKTIFAIEKAIEEAENQSGINIRVTNVGIAGQHIRSSIQHGSITRNSSDDEITIFPISNWGDNKYITIKGLVKFPGSYPIEEGEKLSNVIKRAGGFLSTAFIEASVFTREEVRLLQERRLSQSLDKLRNQVVKASTNAEKVGESKEDAEKKLLAIKQLEIDAKNNRPIGRVSLNLYHDINRFKNSQYDITLKDKDTLYVPSISDTVSVVGEVLNQNTFIYDSELNTQDYLAKAGGPTELANEDYIYIIKANGETLKYEEKFFWGNKKEIFKGDTIIVPMEYDMFSDMKFAKDISSILYQFAITAASLKTVGGI